MPVKPVVAYPNSILRKEALLVGQISEDVKKFCQNLADTMEAATGAGLAACQIGCAYSIFVINKNVSGTENNVFFINPVIKEKFGSQRNKEGCLSFPGVIFNVNRPARLTISYMDIEGKQQELTAEGYYAVAIAHEYDHLHGKLLIDTAPIYKRELLRKKLAKFGGKYYDYRSVEDHAIEKRQLTENSQLEHQGIEEIGLQTVPSGSDSP